MTLWEMQDRYQELLEIKARVRHEWVKATGTRDEEIRFRVYEKMLLFVDAYEGALLELQEAEHAGH